MAASGTELARMLRERRRALGLTRMRLAERSDLSAVNLARWERGEAVPDSEQILVLADAFGLDDDEIQAWLDAILQVGEAEPRVAVEISDPDERRATPFMQKLRSVSSKSGRHDTIRAEIGEPPLDLPPVVAGLERPSESTPVRPAPGPSAGLVTEPGGRRRRDLPAVFPEPQVGSYDPAVRVYSTAPSTYPGPGDDQLYRLRRIRTASVLLGLGVILWWANGALWEGLGDILDLFRSSTTVVP